MEDKKLYECEEITDLKDMLKKSGELYGDKIAYKIRDGKGGYIEITHKEARDMVDALGTALINMGLKGKRVAVIGENRYEWEIAYLSIVCGTGVVVPLDKALTENEIKNLIKRSEVEAIFCPDKYIEEIERIKSGEVGKLKHIISMDLEKNKEGIYSERELIKVGEKLIKEGNREFIDAKINPKEMSIMLFTSGTTSEPKAVALSHYNLCGNLMDIASVIDFQCGDVILSVLPLHHVYECIVGFLFALFRGVTMVFADGLRYIAQNLKEYGVTIHSDVPAVYERIYKTIMKGLEKQGKLEEVQAAMEKYKDEPIEVRKEVFKDIHALLGGKIKVLISGAAALDPEIERSYRKLGFNLYQGYGLTEASPVIAVETDKYKKVGSIGISLPSVEAKIVDPDSEGMGELVVKGPNVMIGYYGNEEATKEVLQDGWLYTGDLAKIDEEGYIFICGRKKSVIVLKNGKNIFPEELENLVNRIEGVTESFIYGKRKNEDKNDVKICVRIVVDKQIVKDVYKVETDEEIKCAIHNKVKEINKIIPQYKAIRGVTITDEPLIKTTTGKIKRQANLDAIEQPQD